MNRKDYINKVKYIMSNNPIFGSYHKINFDRFGGLGESAPVNSSIINDIPRGKVVLSEQVYEMLLAINDVTKEDMKEVPFFLFGTEGSNNEIEFTEFMSSNSGMQSDEASFNNEMIEYLQNRINGEFNDGLVVCHGHSHPPIGKFHTNFSLGDLTTYIQMNEENEVFKNRKVELVGCLLTSTGDINFVFYDNKAQDFYRFTNVYVKDMYGNLTPVNCYGFNQGDSQRALNV